MHIRCRLLRRWIASGARSRFNGAAFGATCALRATLGAASLWLAGASPVRADDAADGLQRAREAMKSGGYSVAMEIYTRLDQAGNAEASRDLGRVYWGGYGVTQDRAKACDLFAKAEAAGDPKATERLAVCFQTGDGRPIDYGRAAELFARAGTRGVASSYCGLARLYLDGLGVAKDPARAAGLCRQGADLGDPVAQTSLGQMYLGGIGVPKDQPEALRWLETAARQDQPDANYLLGLIYWNGQGVPADQPHAAELFFAAATQGSLSAPAFLAKFYYLEGFGLPKREGDAYDIKVTEGPAIKSLFWGMIAANNDPDPEVRIAMLKHVKLISGIAPQLQQPVRALITAGTWPPLH